jgi:uncharacterized damage-inducible protein DinB
MASSVGLLGTTGSLASPVGSPGEILAAMHARDGRRLAEYVFWIRDRILSAAETLPPGQFIAPEPVASRDLRGTLVHELEGEWAWRIRLTSGSFPEDGLAPDAYPTVAALAERWRDEERQLRAWLDTLDDAALASPPPGSENVLILSDYVFHIVAHAVQELSEAGTLLTRLGHSPGNIDYVAFCRDRA